LANENVKKYTSARNFEYYTLSYVVQYTRLRQLFWNDDKLVYIRKQVWPWWAIFGIKIKQNIIPVLYVLIPPWTC